MGVAEEQVLVQQPGDEPGSCFAFTGGVYEIGDTFALRIRKEFEEETTARVIIAKYLFVVENRFRHRGNVVQGLEHYLAVTLDTMDVQSREPHLTLRWLPLATLRWV